MNRGSVTAMNDDEIEVSFDKHRGSLWLHCGGSAFERMRELVLADNRFSGIEKAKVHEIAIYMVRAGPTRARVTDRLWLLGCALVGFVLMFVFAMGIVMIGGWFFGR
jgi:hypothetical protein